jgi:Flp pilus assembly protein TadG
MVTRKATLRQWLGRALLRWRGDRRGVSAVEFALILPVMLLLFAGGSELSEALIVDRKISRTANTIGDLVSQEADVTSAEMTNIFNASTAIMEPYSASTAQMLLIVVNINSASSQTVAWSRAVNDTAATVGAPTPIPVPSSIAVVGTQTIIARVNYSYTSPFSSVMQSYTGKSSYSLSKTFMLRPRLGDSITYTP